MLFKSRQLRRPYGATEHNGIGNQYSEGRRIDIGLLAARQRCPGRVLRHIGGTPNMRMVIVALQRYIDRSMRIRVERAALIQIEDVVAVLTEVVLVFSRLQDIVDPFTRPLSRLRKRMAWTWEQTECERLVSRLQQLKATLSLMLQIIQWSVAHAFITNT